jgi:predicted Kef-type K+ transport protein
MINPQIFAQQWTAVVAASAVILVGSGGGAFLGATLIRVPLGDRLKLAASLAMAGEFSILIAAAALSLDLISDGLFALIVAASAITISLNPFLRVLVARLAQRYA